MNKQTILSALNSLDDDKLHQGDDTEIWKALEVITTAIIYLIMRGEITNHD